MPTLIHLIEIYGLLAVFLNVLGESLGLPLPSYPMLIIAASLTPAAPDKITEIMLIGTGASLLGDSVWYGNGRYFGSKILSLLCKISLSPDFCVRQAGDVVRKTKFLALTYTKFLPGLGTVAIVLSGVTKTPFKKFLVLDALGSLAYIAVAVAIGVVFHDAVGDILNEMTQWGNWGVAALAVLVGTYVAFKWWQRRSLIHQLRMDRISVDELQVLINADQKPVILDAQSAAGRSNYGLIPNAIAVDVHNIKSMPSTVLVGDEIVVYCSCPNEVSAAFVAKQLKRAGFKKIRPLLGGIEAWKDAGLALHPLVEPAVA